MGARSAVLLCLEHGVSCPGTRSPEEGGTGEKAGWWEAPGVWQLWGFFFAPKTNKITFAKVPLLPHSADRSLSGIRVLPGLVRPAFCSFHTDPQPLLFENQDSDVALEMSWTTGLGSNAPECSVRANLGPGPGSETSCVGSQTDVQR